MYVPEIYRLRFKMADGQVYEYELCDVNDVLEGLSPEMTDILRQSGEIDDGDIEVEMLENFSKEEINEARLKIFDYAKQKVAKRLSRPNAEGTFGSEYDSLMPEDGLLSLYAIDQWEIIIRRKKCNFAKDTLELLAYSLANDIPFPAKLVKGQSLNKGSYESVPEAESTAIEKLREDIDQAEGNFSVEIVNGRGNAETHLITIFPDDSSGDKTTSNSASPNAGERLEVPANGSLGPCPTCGESKADNPLVELVSNFVSMSDRVMRSLGKSDWDAKTAYQYHWEFIEKLARDTDDKMKQVLRWQKTVDERLASLEKRDSGKDREEDGNDSDHSSDANEPPVNAVSQRNDIDVTGARVKANTATQKTKPITEVRKRFPARNIQHTPNPRLNPGMSRVDERKNEPSKASRGRAGSLPLADENP